uniref:Glycoside hydrolase family 5 n=1 Tax=uncultured bacterium contig00039 TaxID=1181527 RepID=A0A806KRQ1_9BACT|nr:glycoside hydrolase family 5 [uncultured bacterium contig00039]
MYYGEWGAPTNVRSSMSAAIKNTHTDYIGRVAKAARANGIVPIIWDDGGDFKLLERSSGSAKTGLWADTLTAYKNAINNTQGPGGGGTPPTPTPTPTPGGTPNTGAVNLGSYVYGTAEDGVTAVTAQAVWNLTSAQAAAAKASGAKFILQLTNAPSGAMQLAWQGPTNLIWWKSTDILGTGGSIINASYATWNAGAKILTINLSAALADYDGFVTQPDLRLVIAYYGGSSVDDLGITGAKLE